MRANSPSLQGVLKWVNEMNSLASFPDVEVIIEGARDEEALRFLGVQANFVRAADLLREFREEGEEIIFGKTFIIMTDFDREGENLYRRLKGIITSMGGKVNDSPRRGYKSIGLPQLIEDVKGFIERRVPYWNLLMGLKSV